MITQKYILVLYAINQFTRLFQGYFSVTDETIIERKLWDPRLPRFGGQVRVSVVSNY